MNPKPMTPLQQLEALIALVRKGADLCAYENPTHEEVSAFRRECRELIESIRK